MNGEWWQILIYVISLSAYAAMLIYAIKEATKEK
jgi:hypothetical protein